MVCVGLKVLDNWVGKLTQLRNIRRIALLVWSNPHEEVRRGSV